MFEPTSTTSRTPSSAPPTPTVNSVLVRVGVVALLLLVLPILTYTLSIGDTSSQVRLVLPNGHHGLFIVEFDPASSQLAKWDGQNWIIDVPEGGRCRLRYFTPYQRAVRLSAAFDDGTELPIDDDQADVALRELTAGVSAVCYGVGTQEELDAWSRLSMDECRQRILSGQHDATTLPVTPQMIDVE